MRKLLVSFQGTEGAEPPLVKFYIYETKARLYIVGRDEAKLRWRILKIDRSEPSQLLLTEDPVCYDRLSCVKLLQGLAEGNKACGGLQLTAKAHGIVGFIKFREPYYLMLVKKRVQVGCICGHAIYKVGDSQLITVPHPSVQSPVASSTMELRYKKLMAGVDLTKDFFFSYTYPLMHSLQHNMLSAVFPTGMPFDHMFVWNSYLTHPIRSATPKSTCNGARWIIPLVHGYFDQVQFSIFGRIVSLTLIARRSRHFAGTRYLKRGVNDKGRVANDVETEQIVVDEATVGCGPQQLHASSVVQVRGSIPLFWSQEATTLSPKPDIVLHRFDPVYTATRLHFRNLALRYGEPIIILNLIKTAEKHPREMILRREYRTAVQYLNRTAESAGMEPLEYIHWDFSKYVKSAGSAPSDTSVSLPGGFIEIIQESLSSTGYFYTGEQIKVEKRRSRIEAVRWPLAKKLQAGPVRRRYDFGKDNAGALAQSGYFNQGGEIEDGRWEAASEARLQRGVIRTNCIDCLDRTNVVQFWVGREVLARQLHAVGVLDKDVLPGADKSDIAHELMAMFRAMGDALALQYGGSAAHNLQMLPPDRKRQWRAALKSQELFKSVQRYYSNAITDADKQDALNLFLGHFRPQENQPALWELDSDYHLHIGGPSSPLDSPRELSSRSSMAFEQSEAAGALQADPSLEECSAPSTSADKQSSPHAFTFTPLSLSALGSVGGRGSDLVSFDKLIPRLNLTTLKEVRVYQDSTSPSSSVELNKTSGNGAGSAAASVAGTPTRGTLHLMGHTSSNGPTTSESTTSSLAYKQSGLFGRGNVRLAPTAEALEKSAHLQEKYRVWLGPFGSPGEEGDLHSCTLAGGEGEEFYAAYLQSAVDTIRNLSPGACLNEAERAILDPETSFDKLLEANQETMEEYMYGVEQLSRTLNSDAPNVVPSLVSSSSVDAWISQSLQSMNCNNV